MIGDEAVVDPTGLGARRQPAPRLRQRGRDRRRARLPREAPSRAAGPVIPRARCRLPRPRGAGSGAARRRRHLGSVGDRVFGSTLAAASAFGAVRSIDRRTRDLREALRELVPTGADVVVDPVGGDLTEPALRPMRWGGRFVTVGYASGVIPRIPLNLVMLKGVRIVGFQFIDFATHRPDEFERDERELLELFATHRAFPHLGARFDLAGAARALRHVADGRAVGKVVLDVASRGSSERSREQKKDRLGARPHGTKELR